MRICYAKQKMLSSITFYCQDSVTIFSWWKTGMDGGGWGTVDTYESDLKYRSQCSMLVIIYFILDGVGR